MAHPGVTPHSVEDLLARKYLFLIAKEVKQEIKFLHCEAHRIAGTRYGAGLDVNLKLTMG